MSCYHPLKGWKIDIHPSGKPKYKITSYDVLYLVKDSSNNWLECFEPINTDRYRQAIYDFIEIPCGHCIGCRLKYSADWACRCMLELKNYKKPDGTYNAAFLTLTYNDESLPDKNVFYDADGVEHNSPVHPLTKRHLQLFFKRLRKHYPELKIRYYACGEYGKSMRPHYHAILFGVDFHEDKKLFKVKNGYMYYTSETVKKLWSNPKTKESYGFHIITDVTFDTCAYTARYVAKKLMGERSDVYELYSYPREFSLVSRRPGLARDYYDNNKHEIYKYQEIFLDRKKVKPPRYYDKLFDIQYPEKMSEIKAERLRLAKEHQKLKESLCSYSYSDMLLAEEMNTIASTKLLLRKEV